MVRVEEKIRDNLINHLDILEDGLESLQKEHFIPNKLGTRGFIDILAKDSLGRYVIIELKRSNAASREAMHEVFKYIEGLKENKSLKDDEIRVIIVSTEWRELLIPYSSFVKRIDCSVTGFQLEVDNLFNPIVAVKVEPLELNNDRLLSDQHAYRLYTTEQNLEKGLQSHKDCFRHKGIEDYIILVLKAPEGYREREIASTLQSLNDIAGYHKQGSPLTSVESLKKLILDFQFMLYTAVQVLSKEEYWRIIETDHDNWSEMKELEEEFESDEELLFSLHEYAIDNVAPIPFGERIGIGYPAKLSSSLIDNQGWEILRVVRSGKFEANKLLTDGTIIEEFKGSSGTTLQIYNKDFISSSPASFIELKKGIKTCLRDNPIWRNSLLHIVDEVAEFAEKAVFYGKLHIFNPSNTIYSIYRATQAQDWEHAMRVIPTYHLLIEGDNISRMYFGCLTKNNIKPSLEKILIKYYEGQVINFILPLNWGGYENRDYKIVSDFGLDYSTFLFVKEMSEEVYFKFDGFEFSETNTTDPFSQFFDFMSAETAFVKDIVQLFGEHMVTPGMFTF